MPNVVREQTSPREPSLAGVHRIMCVIEAAADAGKWQPEELIHALIQEAVKVAEASGLVKATTIVARQAFAISRGGIEEFKRELERMADEGLIERRTEPTGG